MSGTVMELSAIFVDKMTLKIKRLKTIFLFYFDDILLPIESRGKVPSIYGALSGLKFDLYICIYLYYGNGFKHFVHRTLMEIYIHPLPTQSVGKNQRPTHRMSMEKNTLRALTQINIPSINHRENEKHTCYVIKPNYLPFK